MPRKKKAKLELDQMRLPTISENGLRNEIIKIFQAAGRNNACHEKCLNKLQELYEKNEEVFFNEFISCLVNPLKIGDKHPQVEFMLDFTAKFCASFGGETNNEDEELEMHSFLVKILEFLIKWSDIHLSGFRYRACQLINKILVCLGDQAELADDLCDLILQAMLKRLQDAKFKVRTQAVFTLFRLQNPADPNDAVTKAYLFHIDYDPHPQVRRAVVNNLARSSKSFAAVFNRIHDVDEKVRRDAYNNLSMYSSKSFKIKQRQLLLKLGLGDESPLVVKCVTDVLLPKWFFHFDHSYFDLLKGIRLDGNVKCMHETIHVSEMLLNVYFKKKTLHEIIDVLPLDTEKKLIETKDINHETVLYWRVLIQFLFKQGDVAEEYLEQILPNLTPFCAYIEDYLRFSQEKNREYWEEILHQAILQQMFLIIECFDLSDEVGRNTLHKLVTKVLLEEKLFEKTTEYIIQIFKKITPNPTQFIPELLEVISNITDPIIVEPIEMTESQKMKKEIKLSELKFTLNLLIDEEEVAVKNKDYNKAASVKDSIIEIRKKLEELKSEPVPVKEMKKRTNSETDLAKALDIIIEMLQTESIKELTPELRSLQTMFLNDICQQSNISHNLLAKALRALGMCAYLDENLAVAVMPKMYHHLLAYQYKVLTNKEVANAALQAVFDLILIYGLKKFTEDQNEKTTVRNNKSKRTLYDNTQINDESDEDVTDDETQIQTALSNLTISDSHEIITCILSYIDCEDEDLRTLVADGFCRLLCSEQFSSTDVLSRLIILWFNPATESDIELRQVVGVMLNHYARNVLGASEEFEKAFLLTMGTVLGAPVASPLFKIDLESLMTFILTYTAPGFNKRDMTNAHNHLALTVCEEILKNSDMRAIQCYIKCLPRLQVSEDDETLKRGLLDLCNQIIEKTQNKSYQKYVQKFIDKMLNKNNVTGSTQSHTTNESSNIERNNVKLDKSLRVFLTRFDQMHVNEDNVSIDDSSPEIRNDNENLVISESDEEDFSSDSDS